jgi:hypothetical protein
VIGSAETMPAANDGTGKGKVKTDAA